MLTRHGIFNIYRITINKENNNQCWYCKEELDDAEHPLFKYPRWASQRTALENHASDTLNTKNIITLVTADSDIWNHFQAFCGSIIKARQPNETEYKLSIRLRYRV